jgi:riboflavin kinase / FMN adenylyltransferase
MKQADTWYEGIVISGSQLGRTLGFPTANLDANLLTHVTREGVYAASVRIDGQAYTGALYIGPRLILDETRRVLEIFVLDFEGDLYGKTLDFQLGTFVRGPMDFDTFDALIVQLEADVAAIRAVV